MTYVFPYLSNKFNIYAGTFLFTSIVVGPLTLITSKPVADNELRVVITDLLKSTLSATSYAKHAAHAISYPL